MSIRLRSLFAASAVLLPLLAAGPVHAEEVGLRDGVAALPLAAESREGYTRTAFRHWIDEDRDGCNTRSEVLLAEAVTAPEVGPRCKVSGGRYFSYYDQVHVDGPRDLDIDHMVPLAEAWDSGASQWTAARRQAYANDLTRPRSLVAVTARTNRSKADQDPSTWLPPAREAQCTYLEDWVTTKLNWGLTVDETEKSQLASLTAECPDTPLQLDPA